MFSRRPFLLVGMALLLMAAFGGLSVGIPLVLAMLMNRTTVEPGAPTILVPSLFLAYGLLSLGGAIGLLAGWRRAALLVMVSQGIVAAGLLWVYAGVAADPSLLIVAGIAGGAALCALADGAFTRPS